MTLQPSSSTPLFPTAFGQDLLGNAHPTRPRRQQVKNACTNCQKACKKCDDVRPCARCARLGIEDSCVNSVRKERRRGIKRGPYKRRKGKESDSASSTPSISPLVAHAASPSIANSVPNLSEPPSSFAYTPDKAYLLTDWPTGTSFDPSEFLPSAMSSIASLPSIVAQPAGEANGLPQVMNTAPPHFQVHPPEVWPTSAKSYPVSLAPAVQLQPHDGLAGSAYLFTSHPPSLPFTSCYPGDRADHRQVQLLPLVETGSHQFITPAHSPLNQPILPHFPAIASSPQPNETEHRHPAGRRIAPVVYSTPVSPIHPRASPAINRGQHSSSPLTTVSDGGDVSIRGPPHGSGMGRGEDAQSLPHLSKYPPHTFAHVPTPHPMLLPAGSQTQLLQTLDDSSLDKFQTYTMDLAWLTGQGGHGSYPHLG
ncbi:uncharacterized protein VTP21DRAFT_2474 [Calcarisporiella thermophila]|uniref:uncharacterized protein n=1 Tax=Calcarisporiella thermophila TaxID=911321 RepID=UPI003742694C